MTEEEALRALELPPAIVNNVKELKSTLGKLNTADERLKLVMS